MTNITTWCDDTVRMVRNRPACLQLQQIAKECGVSYTWIKLFAKGELKNPGIKSVERINEFLTNFKPEA